MKEFFSNASHELKTPLMAVRGYAEGLSEGMIEHKKACAVIIKEIERMYILNDPELIRKVAYELGDRGMPTDKALYMIKLLYTKTQQKKKQLTHYLA